MSLVNTILQNRYIIRRELASGGMGAVYEGDDKRLGVKVAVKEYRLQGEEQLNTETRDYYRQAFEREARLLAALRHDALPRVIDHFTEGDGQYLVMEFIEGDDLMQALKKRGSPFPVAEVLNWADQLLTVLDYLHKRNPPVIHRDIKPQNLKVDNEGRLILIDFGLARGAVKGMTKMAFGKSIGGYTPHFASIEQILRDDSTWQRTAEVILKPEELQQIISKETDAGSDLYSVGATLYCLLTNVIPDNAIERLLATVRNQADPLRPIDEVNPQIAKPVAAVIQQAMNLDRTGRYEDAMKMREFLRTANAAERKIPTVVSSTLSLGNDLLHTGETTVVKPPEKLKWFEFEVVTVDTKGIIKEQYKGKNRYITEDLGGGVPLHLAEIAGGEFWMGATANEVERVTAWLMKWADFNEASANGWIATELPQHKVKVLPFFIGIYPVTQDEWRAIARLPKVTMDLQRDPSQFKGDQRPVEQVSWEEAVEFCKRLSRHTGNYYRLPSEVEWEYACRAGTTTPFHFGETMTPELVNYDGNYPFGEAEKGEYRQETSDVGTFGVANAFGLYDMHGNVYEWCEDIFHNNYTGATIDSNAWLMPRSNGEDVRVLRGGSWYNSSAYCRSANRVSGTPDYRRNEVGFRVVSVRRT
jgi:formylglycine-generating enzyme required for sulfatase activity/tRNA A-37 threonylcarbamoyl transferase component Bud32